MADSSTPQNHNRQLGGRHTAADIGASTASCTPEM
jgi:hypothetical protein